jgi:hypothetical protein
VFGTRAQELGDPTRVFYGRERADNPAMLAWQRRQPHRREVGMKVAAVTGDGPIASMVASKFNEQGHRAVIASPLTSSSTPTVNELAQTFTGAQIVADVTDSPPYEDRTAWDFLYNRTGNLLAAATLTGVSHIVTLSAIEAKRGEMTITETEFEKASLGWLDFDPPCDCQLTFNLFGHICVVRQCDKPSRWAAKMACCKHQTLSCPKHRYSISINHCSRCKQWVPPLQLRWRRI